MKDLVEAKEQTLYRFWNGETLLYVGVSVNAYSRAKQHQHGANWFPEADRVTFEKFPNREAVLNAERQAIKSEKPKFNVVHNRTTSESKFEPKNKWSPLAGLYGFDLVAPYEDDKTLLCPGRVYRVQAYVDGSLYLIEFFQADYGSVRESLGMRLCELSDLVNPHFFQTKKEMLQEYKSWIREYDFWAGRRMKRIEATERMEVNHADS